MYLNDLSNEKKMSKYRLAKVGNGTRNHFIFSLEFFVKKKNVETL